MKALRPIQKKMSDSESASVKNRIDTLLFEKNPVEIKFSVTDETVQLPEKVCIANMNDEENPSGPEGDEENRNPTSPSQDILNL